ncbi:spore coat protein CotS [Anaerobacillus alkalilacustris]|uniref:Spore coat protein CotS n=1 Tax=Anaerobacillus alkalilacustris TaxID=393763 RepID=A0A1S2LE88_9BACI|nr:CotS family spore coat protein [Anaerobacillus alkalilacustris]OIJ10383.1 spore coat protein CotS [Anaerobacillus alkalilacustris]
MSEEQLITPWDLDGTLGDLYVPSYIEEMAQQVVTHYDMTVSHMEVITTKADKGGLIWKINTDKGPMSLKILHRRPTRSLFSLGAQEYLVVEKNAKVPPIIKTKTEENFVEMGGKIWFVAEWIEPLEQVTKDLEGAKLLCSAIGEFHRLSKGYTPPKGAENASRLYRWPKTYKKIVKKMDWFRDIAKAYSEMPASSSILSVVDMFEEQAVKALQLLEQSAYNDLVARGNKEWGLVHQDYGWSNGQKGADGMWIIDLDGVAYDLPIRDLRKLITGTMDDLGSWDYTWAKGMIDAYHEANPIEDELFDILIIDMCLPNLFYKNIKEMLYEPTVFMDGELEALVNRIVQIDQTKWTVIDQLKEDWKGGKSS